MGQFRLLTDRYYNTSLVTKMFGPTTDIFGYKKGIQERRSKNILRRPGLLSQWENKQKLYKECNVLHGSVRVV